VGLCCYLCKGMLMGLARIAARCAWNLTLPTNLCACAFPRGKYQPSVSVVLSVLAESYILNVAHYSSNIVRC